MRMIKAEHQTPPVHTSTRRLLRVSQANHDVDVYRHHEENQRTYLETPFQSRYSIMTFVVA